MPEGAQPADVGGRGWIRNPRDFWGGIALVAVALFAFWAGSDLPGQRGFAFGPGTAPRLFAGMLLVLGAAVALIGLITDGPALDRYAVRGPLFVTAAILAFAGMIRPAGLVFSAFATFVISGMASKETKWVENLIAAVLLTGFCVLLFVKLLQLPFQILPPAVQLLLLQIWPTGLRF
jgi:putative tricarboxylic transport membrane protein